jgi:hypothetical protein
MVFLRNVKLCTVSIVYWCQKLILHICSAQCVELGKNWFFFAAADLSYGLWHHHCKFQIRIPNTEKRNNISRLLFGAQLQVCPEPGPLRDCGCQARSGRLQSLTLTAMTALGLFHL